MSQAWTTVSIGDLCKSGDVALQTGPFGSQLHSYDYLPEGIPVVPTEAIANGRLDHSVLPKISSEKAASLARHVLRPADILFARRGVQATGKTALVRPNEEGFICGTGAIRLRVKSQSDKLDPVYLACLLTDQTSVDWFKFHAIGATMPNLNEGIIKAFNFSLPPLPEQRAIAATLGALDDKIELNRKMNATLEAMARALFRDWFVDFGPTRAKMEARAPYLSPDLWSLFPARLDAEGKPEGWVFDKLGSFTQIKNGYAFKSSDWAAEGVPVVKIGSVKPGLVDISQVSYVSHEIASSRADYQVLPGEMLVGLTGYVGETGVVPPCEMHPLLNQRVGKFEPLKDLHAFVKSAVRQPDFKEFAEKSAHGSAQANVSTRDLLLFPVIHPSVPILRAFARIVEPLQTKQLSNFGENQTLAQTRDLLLPRLMSGELRAADLYGQRAEHA